MNCELSVDELSHRGSAVVEFLKPLSGKVRPAVSRETVRRTHVIFSVHTGPRPQIESRSWRFNTSTSKVKGAYFEYWRPVDETATRYSLQQAYLHLYLQEAGGEAEIVGLHCDPNEPDDPGLLTHAKYKRSPHIHIKSAMIDISHSHIALNLSNLQILLGDVNAITNAFAVGVEMLRDQILDLVDPPRELLA